MTADPSRRSERGRPVASALDAHLRDKGKGEDRKSGNYRADAERELGRFIEWLRRDMGGDSPAADAVGGPTADGDAGENATVEPTFADLDERVFRRYARYLAGLGNEATTTETYYAYVSSFCGWAVDEGYLNRHHAATSVARAPLPEDTGRRSGDQQAWTPEQRDRITRHVDDRASAAIDAMARSTPEEGSEFAAVRACRDRALVYLLAYTGVRAAEILRDPDDTRRTGLRWSDIDFDDRAMTVFRKKQEWDDASLPEPVLHPLRIYTRLLDPPDDEWPVFPTLHRPTLAALVRDGLADRGLDEDEIETVREEGGPDLLVCRDRDLGPPASITANGARKRLKRLCEAAGIELDDRHGYLAPHGGRRGMGEVLVRSFGHAEAARYLDNSEAMVRRRYSHIEAGEQAGLATAALAESDGRVSDGGGAETDADGHSDGDG